MLINSYIFSKYVSAEEVIVFLEMMSRSIVLSDFQMTDRPT